MIIRTFLVFFIAALVQGCATNPVTGKNELSLVSSAQELAIGEQQYVPTQQTEGGQYLVDAALTAYVQEVGNRLAAVSDVKLPYEFVVLNNSTPNAWALPGGKIAINRGLLVQLDNEAELAAVLAHEIVHAAARHGAKSVGRGMLLQGAVALTAISLQDSGYANYILGGASLGAQLVSQRYGRQAELESDLYGMEYMARAGYDPAAAISLQKKFVALNKSKNPGWLEGLFMSHPPSQQRVDQNTETSSTLKAANVKDWEVGKQRYQNRLAYLNSKSEAYQAFDQAVTLRAKKENEVALRRINRAISIEPREPRFYGFRANLSLNENAFDQAILQYSEALSRDDAYYEYYLGRGLAYARTGLKEQAKIDLERSTSLLPTALAANELGAIALAGGERATAKSYFRKAANANTPVGQQAALNFIRLDLADNPAPYFTVTAAVNNGNITILVVNKSGINVSRTGIDVAILLNGEEYRKQIQSGPIAADGQVRLATGWRLESPDELKAAKGIVVAADY
ncbi:MAG: putative Zn-dependent protease [Candidatus Azotimanducaceae bacterium]|jgi:predicted Zn-dependent protease